eukprot:TRINITY_DN6059_c0_g1_i11.p1 TRINITY_DN6059_c0_g1~~TRINITY_DN6059_c0_g1_i11.p1  ORF type:complete len:282 (+),score=18.65 TRINITY_DN6059_c0_g1_i11:180-1025(+)
MWKCFGKDFTYGCYGTLRCLCAVQTDYVVNKLLCGNELPIGIELFKLHAFARNLQEEYWKFIETTYKAGSAHEGSNKDVEFGVSAGIRFRRAVKSQQGVIECADTCRLMSEYCPRGIIRRELSFGDESKCSMLSSEDTNQRQSSSFNHSHSQNREDVNRLRKNLFGFKNDQSRCITVFGYTNDNFNEVIAVSKLIGNIVKYEENKGSLNIEYSTVEEAHSALQLNGALINGNMIGVKECESKDFCTKRVKERLPKREHENAIMPKKVMNWAPTVIGYTLNW